MAGTGSLGLDYFLNSKNRKLQAKILDEQVKMAVKYNDALIAESARQIAETNRQRTITNIQTSQALAHYQKQALGASGANAAAIAQSDARGTASIMLESEVLRQQTEAKAMEVLNLETTHENYNAALTGMINSTKGQFQDLGFVAAAWDQTAFQEMTGFIETGIKAFAAAGGGSAQGFDIGKFSSQQTFGLYQAPKPQQTTITYGTTGNFGGGTFDYSKGYSQGFQSSTGKKGLFG